MAPVEQGMSSLVNPLATPAQLSSSGSQLDGIPADLETSVIFLGARLTQIAGTLLRLPQDIIAQAIVTFSRFWIGAEGGSLREYDAKDVSAASIYLIAKLSAHPKSPRSIINAYAYIESLNTLFIDKEAVEKNDPGSYYVSEGTYYNLRTRLVNTESVILRLLGFQVHVGLPYTLCVNYLQALGVFNEPGIKKLAQRAYAHLNSALLSPQLLYLTNQPPSLATAAIYLAAKEVGVKLPGEQWWEVFDTDREELGFLVVAMISMEGFVREEKQKWTGRKLPLTVKELEKELTHRKETNGGV